jgi:hypothetical protein
MSDDGWGPWTFAAIGMALVMLTALVTGLVVANWTGPFPMAALPVLAPDTHQMAVPAPGRLASPELGNPPQAIVDGCSRYTGEAFVACLRARGYSR